MIDLKHQTTIANTTHVSQLIQNIATDLGPLPTI